MFGFIKRYLDELARIFSDELLITFDYKSVILLMLLILGFTFSVAFKLTTSSSSIWSQYEGYSAQGNTVIGHPKAIRSDEWLVNTPFVLSQVQNGYPIKNPSIGANKDTLLMNLPVLHWSLILKPQHWGFFIFGEERAFSWYWDYKVLLLVASSFLMLMLLTRSNFWLSAFGSFWIFSSSFTQWWFSANVPETIGLSLLATVSFVYLLFSNKKILIFISSLLFILSGFGFVILFYPAFQIPVIILCLTVFIGYYIRNKKVFFSRLSQHSLQRWSFVLISILITFTLIGLYVWETIPTINALTNASYPGKRFFFGGGGLWYYGSGFFSSLISDKNMTPLLGNMSEASNFINLFPVVFITSLVLLYRKVKLDPVVIVLCGYCSLLFIWSVFGFNHFFSWITLMSNVSTARAILGSGLAGLLITIVYLSGDYKLFGKNAVRAFCVSVLLFVLLGFVFFSTTKVILSPIIVLVISGLVILAVYSIVYNRKVLFVLALVILLAPNLKVNPLISGLGVLKNDQLSQAIKSENGNWLVFGNSIQAAYLKAQGAAVLNGVNYTPNLSLWKLFDPENKSRSIYNRYAHIVVGESDGVNAPFTLNQSDSFLWRVNPCDARLGYFGIHNLAFTYQPDTSKYTCLHENLSMHSNGIWFYRVK